MLLEVDEELLDAEELVADVVLLEVVLELFVCEDLVGVTCRK